MITGLQKSQKMGNHTLPQPRMIASASQMLMRKLNINITGILDKIKDKVLKEEEKLQKNIE